MTPSAWTCVLTFPPLAVLALHSLWRYVVAKAPSPMSIIQAATPGFLGWFAWRDLQSNSDYQFFPSITGALLLAFAWVSLLVLVLYELRTPEPFDGLFGRKKRKP